MMNATANCCINIDLVSPNCGIRNLGNTCFFNAATQFLLSIAPIRNAVDKLSHNEICSENCFVCTWEVFARKLINSEQADPLPVLTKLEAESTWVLYEEGDAANIIEKIMPCYSFPELENTFEESRFCLNCEKRQATPRTVRVVKTSIIDFILARDVANLFTEESSVNDEVACWSCNEALGLNCNDPHNRITSPQILQRTLTNTSDWVIFKVGRSIGGDQHSTWAVSAFETNFRGNVYKPVAWVEHLAEVKNNVHSRHYVTYRRKGARTLIFDDSHVAFKAHELLNNTNVVLVVMRRIGSSIHTTVASCH